MALGETAEGRVTTFAETREYATIAEQAGLDSIRVFDHLLFRFPPEPDEGPHEAWTTLSALAPVVPRVELGALVMCSSFRPAGLFWTPARGSFRRAGGPFRPASRVLTPARGSFRPASQL